MGVIQTGTTELARTLKQTLESYCYRNRKLLHLILKVAPTQKLKNATIKDDTVSVFQQITDQLNRHSLWRFSLKYNQTPVSEDQQPNNFLENVG